MKIIIKSFFIILILTFILFFIMAIFALLIQFDARTPPTMLDEILAKSFNLTERECESCDDVKIIIEDEGLQKIKKSYEILEKDSAKYDYNGFDSSNRSVPAKLIFNHENYLIKVRAHGQTPNFHRFGKYISLHVEFLNSTPFPSKKVRFVIYERVSRNVDYLKILSKGFNLISDFDQLINLEINGEKSKLYYMEIPGHKMIKQESHWKNLVNLDTNPFTMKEDKILFNEKYYQLDSNYRENINKIVNSIYYPWINSQDIWVDEEYLSSMEAVRMLGSFGGHAFNKRNFILFYDKKMKTLYPMLIRDEIYYSIPQIDANLEYWFFTDQGMYNSTTSFEIPFLIWVESYEKIRLKKFEKVYRFLKNYHLQVAEFKTAYDKHLWLKGPLYQLFNSLLIFFNKRAYDIFPYPKEIERYWHELKKILEVGDLSLQRFSKGLQIIPKSLAPLELMELKIVFKDEGKSLQKKDISISIKKETLKGDEISFSTKNRINHNRRQFFIQIPPMKVVFFHPNKIIKNYHLEISEEQLVENINLKLRNILTQHEFYIDFKP